MMKKEKNSKTDGTSRRGFLKLSAAGMASGLFGISAFTRGPDPAQAEEAGGQDSLTAGYDKGIVLYQNYSDVEGRYRIAVIVDPKGRTHDARLQNAEQLLRLSGGHFHGNHDQMTEEISRNLLQMKNQLKKKQV